jgi:DNA-binding CsgD family transcriptional regulator
LSSAGAPNATALSTALSSVYEAALAPVAWENAAHSIRRVVGGHSVNLVISDLAQTSVSRVVSSGFRAGDGERYERDILPIDDQLPLLSRFEPPGFGFSNTLENPPRMERLRSYEAFYREIGYLHFAVILIQETPTHRSFLTVARAAGDPPFRRGDAGVLGTLRPHLQRAVEVNRLLDREFQTTRAIDRLDFAVYLLDDVGRLECANVAARTELSGTGLLSLERGLLRPAKGVISRPGIELVVAGLLRGRNAAARLSRPADATDAMLLAVPSRHSAVVVPTMARYVGELWLIRRRGGGSVDKFLSHVFSLTPAELRLVRGMMSGGRLPEIAADLSISVHTARTQLKAVLAKTQSRGQSDLIAILSKLSSIHTEHTE